MLTVSKTGISNFTHFLKNIRDTIITLFVLQNALGHIRCLAKVS